MNNAVFARHFFTFDRSIFDLIENQQNHTQNILSEIQTYIYFNNNGFEIDRNTHLDKLRDQSQQISILSGIGGVGKTVIIKNLYEELKELHTLSDKYSFSLPKNEKLLELIRNPFYLNEYLTYYNNKGELDYKEFKAKLWNKIIKKSNPERERCFLQIAFERANKGQFFISPNCESSVLLNELVKDGILGYETAGYFITHDIYEEWALEKIIESEFIKKLSKFRLGFCIRMQ